MKSLRLPRKKSADDAKIQEGWDEKTELERRAIKPQPARGFIDCFISPDYHSGSD